MTTSFVQQSFTFGGTEPPHSQRRNAVIEAGAGTGKTTRIVKEVVLRLIQEPDLRPERIVLVTFTEKAAAEIADRVRWALTELYMQRDSATLQWPARSAMPILEFDESDRASVLAAAEAQLQRIDRLKSQTIHSFCQSVLRSHAIDAAIDPRFRIVQGFEQSQLMNEVFDQWFAEETSDPDRTHLAQWQHTIERSGKLSTLRETIIDLLAKRELLSDEHYTLGHIDDIHEAMSAAVKTLAAIPPEGCTSEKATLAGDYFRQQSPPAASSLDAWIDYLEPVAEVLRGCDLNHFKGAKNAIRLLRGEDRKRTIHDQLLQHQAAVDVRALAVRYAAALDAEKRVRGVLDFDDLLILTDRLLENEAILRDVRERYDFIFVDEFQDTDRVQARIIDRLARGSDGKFVAGKTVLVGDPKQSIYSFRRADPEMFIRTLERFVYEGADREYLQSQYRSDPALVSSINAMFARLFPDSSGTVSAYVARPTYRALVAGRPGQHREGEARIRFVAADLPEGEDRDWAEAEIAADHIERNASGEFRKFAILMRKMTNSAVYADVFARRGIPLILPPGRAFLDQPPVVDLLAVLRAIAFPFDRGSVISAARSPYFGLSDDEIARRFMQEPEPTGASLAADESSPQAFATFEGQIERYAFDARHLRVSEVIDRIIEEREIETTFSMLRYGARDLAQLRRFRDLASEYDLTKGGSLRQFVTELARRRSFSDEAEPVWADETANAVRMMTIHASKGLEFDTVIMPDLGSGTSRDDVNVIVIDQPPTLAFTGAFQSISAEHHLLGGETLKEIDKERDEAEVNRLFYVSVTRAKSDVVFISTTAKKKTESFWKPLTAIFGFEVKTVDALYPAGRGEVLERFTLGDQVVDVVFERATNPERSRSDISRFVSDDVRELLSAEAAVVADLPRSPALEAGVVATRRAADRKRGSGIVVHRALELWNGAISELDASLVRTRAEFALNPGEVEQLRRRLRRLAGSKMMERIRSGIVLAKELPIFYLDDFGVAGEGRIDLVLKEGDGLTVVDYKSGEAYSDRREKDSAQVGQYCVALEKMTSAPVNGVLWYLDSDEVVDVAVSRGSLAGT